jgi:tartrate dehydratase alpha subunit/fumarate hydratase class I-like protein
MRDLTKAKARVGNHNPQLIYFDPVDKPEGERGGGSENMVALTVGEPGEAVELAAWLVETINRRLDAEREDERRWKTTRKLLGEA